jgi:uncharacterized damage-inducible protein DinB
MQLITTSLHILNQLKDLATQLSDEEFSAELDLLQANSVGKHMRHIVEFFDLLVHSDHSTPINYDQRKHDPILEADRSKMIAKIEAIQELLQSIEMGSDLELELSYTDSGSDTVVLRSSVDRELAYNIEHAIHHMAIMKMALVTVFPRIRLDNSFGIAYSTMRYQKKQD